MEEMNWYEKKLIEGVRPTSVYAILLTKDGRVLVRYKDGGVRRVTGGHLDPEDEDIEAALRRELVEEINCTIDRCDYLGYALHRMPNGTEEILVLMVARLADIGAAQPDPACEDVWTYGRAIVPVAMVEQEIVEESTTTGGRFTKIMPEVMKLAIKVAKEKGYFEGAQSNVKEIINLEEHNK